MPRKGPVTRREIAPDLIYGDILVARLINQILRKGKKGLAEKIVYEALDLIKEKAKEDPLVVLRKAVENSRPLLEVRPRRVGGATYQVPVEVESWRGTTLSLRWIVQASKEKGGAKMAQRLANEILDAAQGTGTVIKRKEDLHKMAEANRAFAHYRW